MMKCHKCGGGGYADGLPCSSCAGSGEFDIRALRQRHGLTQRDLARRLRVDPVTISRWETGTRSPDKHSAERLRRLATRLEQGNGRTDQKKKAPGDANTP
mgnify:CR=1 FL=1